MTLLDRSRELARQLPPVSQLLGQRDSLGARVTQLEAELAAAHHEIDLARADAAAKGGVGAFPAGHYYSPIPDATDIETRAEAIWRSRDVLPGIDLDAVAQLELMSLLADSQPVPADPRYTPENPFYGWGDGIVLRGMLAKSRPQKIIEVGSGWSSALILDTVEATPDWSPQLTFIEPYPERLHELLRAGDEAHATIHSTPLQDTDLDALVRLSAGDLLFIDSTHVSKVGSDVNYLFFEVIPALADGVLIHIHDAFWPFEYPRDWVLGERRYWNEDYLLRALLTHNSRLSVVLFNDWLHQNHHDEAAARLPGWARNTGGAIWLKVGPHA